MFRRFLPIALSLVFACAALAMLSRSETALFPCKRDDFIYGAGRGGYGMGMRDQEKVSCSLGYLTREDLRQYNAKLEPTGWALLILLGLVLPGGLGFGAGKLITRKAPS